jgi:hypothetical protein
MAKINELLLLTCMGAFHRERHIRRNPAPLSRSLMPALLPETSTIAAADRVSREASLARRFWRWTRLDCADSRSGERTSDMEYAKHPQSDGSAQFGAHSEVD